MDHEQVDVGEEALFPASVSAHGHDRDTGGEAIGQLTDASVEGIRQCHVHVDATVPDPVGDEVVPEVEIRTERRRGQAWLLS
jgi:hypothetical protein